MADKDQGENFWRKFSKPAPLGGTGLKAHVDSKLTEEQKQDLKAPQGGFVADLEAAAREKQEPLTVGKLEDAEDTEEA